MDRFPSSRLAEGLAALDPADRALLELSFRGGMPTEEVAAALGSSQTSVVDRRDDALAILADALGEQRGDPGLEHALAEADEQAWRPPPALPDAALGDGERPADELPAGESESDRHQSPRRLGSLRRRLILLGLAALALGIAAGILIATSNDDSDERGESSRAGERSAAGDASGPSPARPERELGPVVELEQQIQGVDGEVSARLIRTGGRARLALRARDLPKPKASYEVWLLDAPKRAISLARFRTEDFELDARLPADFAGYQQLDVTVELDDGNEDHSGVSAFRTDVANLAIR